MENNSAESGTDEMERLVLLGVSRLFKLTARICLTFRSQFHPSYGKVHPEIQFASEGGLLSSDQAWDLESLLLTMKSQSAGF